MSSIDEEREERGAGQGSDLEIVSVCLGFVLFVSVCLSFVSGHIPF